MSEKQSQPETKLRSRMTVESNSAHSTVDDNDTHMDRLNSVKSIVIATHESNNKNDSKDNDDFVEMEQILHDVIETKQDDNNNINRMQRISHIEISVPNKRLSNTFRQNRHKRPVGSSIMGSQNIMGTTLMKLKIPEHQLSTPEDSRNSHSDIINESNDIAGDGINSIYEDDGINEIIEILKKDINDRIKHEIDILINYFEQFKIIPDDIYTGHQTFRAFIQETKYLYLTKNDKIGDKNNENLCFYFILNDNNISGYGKNEVFGFNEIHNLDRSCNFYQCRNNNKPIHLAYWDIDTYNKYIRQLKELNNEIAAEQLLLHDKHGNLLTESDLIEKASMFLDDAIHGRDFKMHRNGNWPKKIHTFLNAKYTRYFLIFICLLWLMCIQFEPPSTIYDTNPRTTQYNKIMQILIFEWCIFIILLFECLLRFYSFGQKWFFKDHLLHKIRVILLFIFFIDLLISTILNGNSFSIRRILRPFFLMLFIRDLRRQYFILWKTFPSIIEIIMLYLALTGIGARLGYHIFSYTSDVYNKDEFFAGSGTYEKYLKNQIIDPSALEGDYIWYSFDTFFLSSMSLFVLLTSENFPELLWPAWLSNHIYYGYFLVYLMVSTFFLMNLFSASVYNAYLSIIAELDVDDEKKELQALAVAWNCLDYDEKGYIEFNRFSKLIRKLKPKYNEFEINVLFQLMDPNQNGKIEEDEFNDMMINCLYFSISKRTNSREDEMKLYLQALGAKLGTYGYDILSIFTSDSYKNFILFTISIDVCALLSYHMYPMICNYCDALCMIIIIFDTFINIIILKFNRYFEATTNRIYFVITIIQLIGTIVGIINALPGPYLSGLRFIGISRILIMAGFLRKRFSFLKSQISNTLTQTVIYMIPVFLRICFYLFVGVFYVFSVIGMELFYNWHDETTWGKTRCDGKLQLEQNTYALFCDANATLITLFQILTTNNWHIIMYQAIEITGNWFVSIYFILFFVAGPILVVNFLLAVFFDMFFGASKLDYSSQLLDQVDEFERAEYEKQQHDLLNCSSANSTNNNSNYNIESMNELPTECGINILSDENKTKVLTVNKTNHLILQLNNNNIEYILYKNLIHITFNNICKSLFFIINLESYSDINGNVFNDTFNGENATQCFLNLKYAPDQEDAIDYLSQIMDQEAAFSRIDNNNINDTTIQNKFVNDKNAHYQWNIVFDKRINTQRTENLDEVTRQVTIGVRHSYGGFQRLMKHNRRTGAPAPIPTNNNNDENGGLIPTHPSNNISAQTPMTINKGIASPKTNLFSTRNLLSFQQHVNQQSGNGMQMQIQQEEEPLQNQIKNALVILIGNTQQKEMEQTFEQKYNFTVIKANNYNLTFDCTDLKRLNENNDENTYECTDFILQMYKCKTLF